MNKGAAKGGFLMTWVARERQKFEQAMKQFRGKRFHCFWCGKEGEYEKDLAAEYVEIGEWGVLDGNTYTASFKATFACKDHAACPRRRENKAD